MWRSFNLLAGLCYPNKHNKLGDMMTVNIGALKKAKITEAWPNEAKHFTPWLANNIGLLSEEIGMDLEVVGSEQSVGKYYIDILARTRGGGKNVIIENQYGKTDHKHLGQSLTYAAGSDPCAVVWVSEKFEDEHLAVLDWLNEKMGPDVAFFGVEIQLYKIGESPPAPHFSVVSKPNDLSSEIKKTVQQAGLTEGQKLQVEFWEAYLIYLGDYNIPFGTSKPAAQNWFNHSIGMGNFHLAAVASTWNSQTEKYEGGELRAELYIKGSNSKKIVELLEGKKESIHQKLGDNLIWHNMDENQSVRLYLRKSVNLKDRIDWPNQHQWLKDTLIRLYKAFKPHLSNVQTQLTSSASE